MEPGSQHVIAGFGEGLRVHEQSAHRLAPIADAAKNEGAVQCVALLERGAPEAPFVVGEHALAPGPPVRRDTYGGSLHPSTSCVVTKTCGTSERVSSGVSPSELERCGGGEFGVGSDGIRRVERCPTD